MSPKLTVNDVKRAFAAETRTIVLRVPAKAATGIKSDATNNRQSM